MRLSPALSILIAVIGLADAPVQADVSRQGFPLAELKQGGYVLYLRHGATQTDQRDVFPVDLSACRAQRNLSEAGRTLAIQMGRKLAAAGVKAGRVWSSAYCRARDTAQLAFGRAETETALNYSFADSPEQKAAKAARLRQLLAAPPKPGEINIIVSHTTNLQDALALWPHREGDALVFRPGPDGPIMAGGITADEWMR